MVFDVLPGCVQLAVAADAAAADDRSAGVSEAELVGVVPAWDRVEAHAAARSWPRSLSWPAGTPARGRRVHRRSGRLRAGGVPVPCR